MLDVLERMKHNEEISAAIVDAINKMTQRSERFAESVAMGGAAKKILDSLRISPTSEMLAIAGGQSLKV